MVVVASWGGDGKLRKVKGKMNAEKSEVQPAAVCKRTETQRTFYFPARQQV